MSSVPCLWPFLAGLCVAAGSAACDVNVRDGKASLRVFSAQATEEWTRQYPLEPDGLVEIVNINGPVVVSAGTPGTVDVLVTITAKALTEASAKEILSKGSIQEAAGVAHVRLETMMPRGMQGSYEARYDVKVPAGAQADLSVTNGSLTVNGLRGKVKVAAVNGAVELTNLEGEIDAVGVNGSLTAKLDRVSAAVRLEMTNGPLTLHLPATSRANLSARIVNGPIYVTGLRVEDPTGRRIRTLEVPLNGGGPEISLRTTNGRIDIEGK